MDATLRGTAAQAGDHRALETGARLGYAASGVLHLLIAWIALQVAWGQTGESADQTGAMQQLAGNPLGAVLLWVLAVGFALLAVWQVAEAIARSDTGTRLKSAGKAVLYLALAWTAVSVVRGSSSGSGQTESTTATLMAQPFGRALVALVGLGVIAVAVYHVIKGWKKKFLEDLREHPGPWVVRAGRIGYIAKGVALGVVGALFVAAAATADSERASGLDGALRSLQQLPFGKALLTAVALGLAAYGVYSFGRARHAKV
ncbi:DUF1206 domain-containing protein [Georgenia daeguensis]|uniref:DUF1206 domain-containing protein n=1 Tax=Georgenia daeguensis TaxID=908355 RepID=UPI0031E7BCAE